MEHYVTLKEARNTIYKKQQIIFNIPSTYQKNALLITLN